MHHVIPDFEAQEEDFHFLLVGMRMVQILARVENLVKYHQQIYQSHFPPLKHSQIRRWNSILECLELENINATAAFAVASADDIICIYFREGSEAYCD